MKAQGKAKRGGDGSACLPGGQVQQLQLPVSERAQPEVGGCPPVRVYADGAVVCLLLWQLPRCSGATYPLVRTQATWVGQANLP